MLRVSAGIFIGIIRAYFPTENAAYGTRDQRSGFTEKEKETSNFKKKETVEIFETQNEKKGLGK